MKFFKCHSQKYKNELLIELEDKFTDIGPDVFAECSAQYIFLSEKTKVLRDYAFSGIYTKCGIYLPPAIDEIEMLAFEGMGPDVTMYCRQGSYAATVCAEHGVNVCYDIDALRALAQEYTQTVEAQRKQERLEKERIERERAEQERLEKERIERERAEQERLEKERIERERAEQERLEKERIERERAEQERLEKERIERERAEQERLENERIAREQAEQETEEQESSEAEETTEAISDAEQEQNDAVEYEVLEEQETEEMVRLHIYDVEQGEHMVLQPISSFSEEQRRYICDGIAYAYRTNIDEQNVFEIVDKAGYIKFKSEIDPNICPGCGAPNMSNGKFCTRCGYLLHKKKFCTQCGQEISDESKFCRHCGVKV